MSNWSIIAGPSSEPLAKNVANDLNMELFMVESRKFPDGEEKLKIENISKIKKAIVIQGTHPPVNTNLVQLLFIANKLKKEGVDVHVCIPYLGYARQDSEFQNGEIVSLEMMADSLEMVGIKTVATVDIHSTHGLGYFAIPIYSISAMSQLAAFVKNNLHLEAPLAVSPDFGGSERVQKFADILNIEKISLKKSRSRTTGNVEMEETNIEVTNRDLLIIDDIISTGTSIQRAAKHLKELNAKRMITLCTHPLLLGKAIDKIKGEGVERIIGTNTLQSPVSEINISSIIAEHYKTKIIS